MDFLGSITQIVASANLETVTAPVVDLLETVFTVAIPLVGAVGAIFCIVLGIKLAKAEEPQDREKAKQGLKNAVIGFVLIFVLVIALRFGIPVMSDWLSANPAPSPGGG